MNNNLTEMVFILDRSGSMNGLVSDTIGGFNSLIERQKKEEGEALVTTVLFDDKYEVLHDHVNIKDIASITEKEYFSRGMTALLDAVGKTITQVEHRQNFAASEDTPEKTMVVIITDGLENASQEYSLSTVRKMIEAQQEKHGWEFIFLGANIDAVQVGGSLGISAERSVNYHADGVGTSKNFAGISMATSALRGQGRKITEDWRKKIDEDFKKRKK